jgi:hypothetical protein
MTRAFASSEGVFDWWQARLARTGSPLLSTGAHKGKGIMEA